MTEMANQYNKDIDIEWLELLQEAKKIGLTFDQIQSFLQQGGTSEK